VKLLDSMVHKMFSEIKKNLKWRNHAFVEFCSDNEKENLRSSKIHFSRDIDKIWRYHKKLEVSYKSWFIIKVRVFERISYEQSKKIVYICGYPQRSWQYTLKSWFLKHLV